MALVSISFMPLKRIFTKAHLTASNLFCSIMDSGAGDSNPLLEKSPHPHGWVQWDKISSKNSAIFPPAFDAAMKEHIAEIDAITNNADTPTFENTLVALESAGSTLQRVRGCFSQLVSADTNENIQKIDVEYSSKLTAHSDSITLNKKLFARVAALWEKKDSLNLVDESARLLWRYHTDFVRAGARLDAEKMETLKKINEELSTLETNFQQNVLKGRIASSVWFDTEEELAGLTAEEIETAKQNAANADDKKGNFLIKLVNTTQQPCLVPLTNRDTRAKILDASKARNLEGDFDNRPIIVRVAKLRVQKAKLLGFKTFAEYVLSDEMIATPENAMSFLKRLVPPVVRNAETEKEELIALSGIAADDFSASDWDHWSDKVKAKKYGFDGDVLKPFLEVNNFIENGVLYAANQLYGITFKQRTDLPVYEESVVVYDVAEEDGTPIGVFWLDQYSRDSKNGGAWMCEGATQSKLKGQLPIIGNHNNTPPTSGKAFLDIDQVITAYHEFGHGLHGLLSNVQYPKLAGTSTPRDFVEMPSQFNETWAFHPAIAPNYLKHHESGECIDPELIKQIKAADLHNQGYATAEYLSACLVDLELHMISDESEVPDVDDLMVWQSSVLEKHDIALKCVPPRYSIQYFAHPFGGYAAGYNSYIYSEASALDCAERCKELAAEGKSLREVGAKYRKDILGNGGSQDFTNQLTNFLGRDVAIEPLLKARGLN